jgi:WD40 repeat protein
MNIRDFVSCLCVIPGHLLIAAIGIKSDYLYAWDASDDFSGEDVELVFSLYCEDPITAIINCQTKFNKYFLTASMSGTIKVWSSKENKALLEIRPHRDKILCMHEITKNKVYKGCFVAGSEDNTFSLFSFDPDTQSY